jgi:hypothetical protein
MATIDDLHYAFGIATKEALVEVYFSGELTQRDLVKYATYFIDNLPLEHNLNGNVWATITGIINDFNTSNSDLKRRSISHKQAVYLIGNLYDYNNQMMVI